jgi:hypothetical protein
MTRNFQVIILFVTKILIVRCKYFSVVAPAVLRADEPYRVAVTSHDSESDEILSLKLAVKGVSKVGEYVEVYKNISLNSSQTKTTKFRVRTFLGLVTLKIWRSV